MHHKNKPILPALALLPAIMFLSLCTCATLTQGQRDAIYEIKGYNRPFAQLKPVILRSWTGLSRVLSINKKSCIAAVNDDGEFCLVKISKSGSIDVDVVVDNFPPKPGKYSSDPESNVVWCFNVKAFYALDIDSEKTLHDIANNVWGRIDTAFMIDREKSLLALNVYLKVPM